MRSPIGVVVGTMTELAGKATTLLELHQPGNPVILPTVWDAWSANLAISAGFTALTVGATDRTRPTPRSRSPTDRRRHGLYRADCD